MMKLVVLSALVALAVADVKHVLQPGFRAKLLGPSAFPALPVVAPVSPQYRAGAGAGTPEGQAQVLRSVSDIQPDGSYNFAYETSNGISADEAGHQKQIGNEFGNAAQGSYRYKSPEGELVELSYIADENGVQVQGTHVPTAPPIPEAILRSLPAAVTHQ